MNIYKKWKQYRAKRALNKRNKSWVSYYDNAKPLGRVIGIDEGKDGCFVKMELNEHGKVVIKELAE